jgi:DNA polymerase sigma
LAGKQNPELTVKGSICFNKYIGMKNSKLLATYCKFEPRFKEVALVLKHFNKQYIPDAKYRIDSYSFT